jgi:hypothetical protein
VSQNLANTNLFEPETWTNADRHRDGNYKLHVPDPTHAANDRSWGPVLDVHTLQPKGAFHLRPGHVLQRVLEPDHQVASPNMEVKTGHGRERL